MARVRRLHSPDRRRKNNSLDSWCPIATLSLDRTRCLQRCVTFLVVASSNVGEMTRPLSIFIAEDNPGDVALVREALQEHNVAHRLVVASDGAEAKRYIEEIGKTPGSV